MPLDVVLTAMLLLDIFDIVGAVGLYEVAEALVNATIALVTHSSAVFRCVTNVRRQR